MQKDRRYVSNSCQIQTVIKTAWNVSETFEMHKIKLKTWFYQINIVKLLSYNRTADFWNPRQTSLFRNAGQK